MTEERSDLGCAYLAAVNPEDLAPAWQQIAAQIRTAILTGEIRAGEMLPSQPRLADHYGVARETIKTALACLRNEGLIRSRKGKGTYVRVSKGPTKGEHQIRVELRELHDRICRLNQELATVEAALGGLVDSWSAYEDQRA
ncbi:winged helix-turn-helix domain-containing protein [Actinomadura alba]|uniref:Winged helix-turn-helix transcriptional regulator n=1 Tax=Actinomadura alba TaxID=406431 RepID=A0ABR7LWG6_9ACTN|nr:winged helix-turn-helix domain-containing protein [Actinomadura alba]MBC6469104.1 winged helix-turn-helix transcriptional regulator [Actinomadura alba]